MPRFEEAGAKPPMSLDDMEGNACKAEQGVIIIDYQKLYREGIEKLARKTNEVDRLMEKTCGMTREMNKLTAESEGLNQTIRRMQVDMNHKHENEFSKYNAMIEMKDRKYDRDISERNEMLAMKEMQIKDKDCLLECYRLLETAKWIIETERVLKRART